MLSKFSVKSIILIYLVNFLLIIRIEAGNVNSSSSIVSTGLGDTSLVTELKNVVNRLFPVQDSAITDVKVGLLESLSKIGTLNPFTYFDSFIHAWRSTLPSWVPIGNFTLLQTALVFAIGGLATGSAVLAAEAFYFRSINEQHFLLRREYELEHGSRYEHWNDPSGIRQPFNTKIPNGKRVHIVPVTLPPKRFKPQSLKRNQRRNQRKNKNAGQQLSNYKKMKEAAARKAIQSQKRKGRRKRQLIRRNTRIRFPTVAPRSNPYVLNKNNLIPGQHHQYLQLEYPKIPSKIDQGQPLDIFSLNYMYNFFKQKMNSMVNWLPFNSMFTRKSSKTSSATDRRPFYPQKLNFKKNLINHSFSRPMQYRTTML